MILLCRLNFVIQIAAQFSSKLSALWVPAYNAPDQVLLFAEILSFLGQCPK